MRTILTIMICACMHSFSQEKNVRLRNDIQFNIGKSLYDGYSKTNNYSGFNRILFMFSYNGQVTENFGIGVYTGMTSSSTKFKGTVSLYDYNTSSYVTVQAKTVDRDRRFFIGPKLTLYLLNTQKFQFFGSAGIAIGRFISSGKAKLTPLIDPGSDLSPYKYQRFDLTYDLQLGGNYYFNTNWGVTAALGYKTGIIRLGVTYKY